MDQSHCEVINMKYSLPKYQFSILFKTKTWKILNFMEVRAIAFLDVFFFCYDFEIWNRYRKMNKNNIERFEKIL